MSTKSGSSPSGQLRALEFLGEAKQRLDDASAAGDDRAQIVLERVCDALRQPKHDAATAPRSDSDRFH